MRIISSIWFYFNDLSIEFSLIKCSQTILTKKKGIIGKLSH